jgi:ABC-type transport system substrate-binding protein
MRELRTRRHFVKSLAAGSLGLLAAACGPSAPTAPSGNVAPATVGAAGGSAPATAPGALATAIAQAVTNNPGSGPAPFGSPPTGVPQVPATGVAQGAGGPAPQPKGNRLVIGMPRPSFETNNVARGSDTYLGIFHYENLVGLDYTTGNFVGHLAEKWQVEPNGKDVRFFLRKGVKFHNDLGEVTADDVKFTYDQITGDGPTNNPFQSTVKDITGSVEIINPYEVVWIGNHSDAVLWWYQSQAGSGFDGVMSKHDFDQRGGKMPDLIDINTPPLAGTAPYQFKSRTQGQNLVLQKVPYKHWRVDADFQEAEIRFFTEPAAKLSALLAGELGLTQLTRDQRDLAISKGMKLFRSKVVSTGAIVQFLGSYPVDPDNSAKGYKYPDSPIMNANVRKALTKAVNRDEINKLFLNEGVPMWCVGELEGQPGWNPDWSAQYQAEYGYDPEKAKALLAQEGYGPSKPLSITLEVFVTTIPESPDITEAVAGMWKAVGVNANIETLDPATYTKTLRALQFNNHAVVGTAGGVQPWVLLRGQTAHFNAHGGGFEDFDFEKAIYTAWAEPEPVKQDALARTAYNIDYARHAHVPLWYLFQEVVGNPKVVSAFDFAGNGAFTFFNAAVRAA